MNLFFGGQHISGTNIFPDMPKEKSNMVIYNTKIYMRDMIYWGVLNFILHIFLYAIK